MGRFWNFRRFNSGKYALQLLCNFANPTAFLVSTLHAVEIRKNHVDTVGRASCIHNTKHATQLANLPSNQAPVI